MNSKTGGGYRLPTEAEWEYAARAGSTTKYFFGNDKSRLCDYANHYNVGNDCFDSVFGRWLSDRVKGTAEVGSYQPDVFGLYDMYGNVREWVQDCWNENYEGAPSDGSGWESGDCSVRVLRGGHWHSKPKNLRSSDRGWAGHAYTLGIGGMLSTTVGFRLARNK